MGRKIKPFVFTAEQEAWLKELETGKRTQTSGFLSIKKDSGTQSFCCLGVGCDLLKDQLGLAEYMGHNDGAPSEIVKYYPKSSGKPMLGEFTILPKPVQDTLRLWGASGEVYHIVSEEVYGDDWGYSSIAGLANVNDNGVSFARIAKRLRAYPYAYFRPPGCPVETFDLAVILSYIWEPDPSAVSEVVPSEGE